MKQDKMTAIKYTKDLADHIDHLLFYYVPNLSKAKREMILNEIRTSFQQYQQIVRDDVFSRIRLSEDYKSLRELLSKSPWLHG